MYCKEIREAQRIYNKHRKNLEWPQHNFLTSKGTRAIVQRANKLANKYNKDYYVHVHFSYDYWYKYFEAEVSIYGIKLDNGLYKGAIDVTFDNGSPTENIFACVDGDLIGKKPRCLYINSYSARDNGFNRLSKQVDTWLIAIKENRVEDKNVK